MRYGFGNWTPDLPSLAVGGGHAMLVARNCIPRRIGYGPMPRFSSLSLGALTARARGALAVVDHNGNIYNFAGDATKLYRTGPKQTAPEDISRAAGYALNPVDGWELKLFGPDVFAASQHTVLQRFDVLSGSTFLDVDGDTDTDVIGVAPRAKHMGIVRDHLIVGNTYDQTDGESENRVWWPAIGNARFWPDPRTDTAVAVQSGFNDLGGSGGNVMGIVEGSEVGAVLQESAVWRMDYIGGVDVYDFFRVEPDRGSIIPGLALSWGRSFIYCNEDGFWRSDYSSSQPIGEEVINRTFLADLDQGNIHRVTAVTDPNLPLSFIAYPGAGNTAGRPNKLLVYHWVDNKFAIIDSVDVQVLVQAAAPTISIDDYPASPDLDSLSGSLDDRPSDYGPLSLGAYDSTNELGEFTGAAMEATLETGAIEGTPGRRSKLSDVRPLIEGGDCAIQIGGVQHLGGAKPVNPADTYGRKLWMDKRGRCGGRLDARYHFIRATAPNGFDHIIGLDMEMQAGGKR